MVPGCLILGWILRDCPPSSIAAALSTRPSAVPRVLVPLHSHLHLSFPVLEQDCRAQGRRAQAQVGGGGGWARARVVGVPRGSYPGDLGRSGRMLC